MADRSVQHVTDAATLKAVTHPLRVRLLGSLRVEGPQTASELGRRFDESSGTTSYHLRVLAKHGYIEEDPDQPNARDRRWRATHQYTSWSDAEARHDAEFAEAARQMRYRQLDNVVRATERFETEAEQWGEEWQHVAGHSDYALRLTPAALRALKDDIQDLIHRYADRYGDAGDGELVRLYLAAIPVNDSRY